MYQAQEHKRRPHTSRLYTSIREEYSRMTKITKHGKQKYTHECIVAELSQKFFRSERTIENIIFNRV